MRLSKQIQIEIFNGESAEIKRNINFSSNYCRTNTERVKEKLSEAWFSALNLSIDGHEQLTARFLKEKYKTVISIIIPSTVGIPWFKVLENWTKLWNKKFEWYEKKKN